jgi:hypothetical protein
VLSYSVKFRRLASDTGYNNCALLELFRSGLNDNIKDVLATSLEEPKELPSFIHFCIQVDNRLHNREVERRFGSTTSYPSPSETPVPMDLDALRTQF